MNGAHLHLIVNHVSLFALVIGAIALMISLKRKSVELRGFASALFVVAGVFAWIAYKSGGNAADIVKALGGNNDSFIEAHAGAAVWALRSGTLVAIVALVMEWAACKKKTWAKGMQWVLLILALHGCSVFAMTALQGGKIRHTEIRSH